MCKAPDTPMSAGLDTLDTLYARLGVDLNVQQSGIRAAFYSLAKRFHPDRCPGAGAAGAARFQEIQQAYEVLSDPARRRAYDMQLLHLLDVEDYLSRFRDLLLTASGLGLPLPGAGFREDAPAPPAAGPAGGPWQCARGGGQRQLQIRAA